MRWIHAIYSYRMPITQANIHLKSFTFFCFDDCSQCKRNERDCFYSFLRLRWFNSRISPVIHPLRLFFFGLRNALTLHKSSQDQTPKSSDRWIKFRMKINRQPPNEGLTGKMPNFAWFLVMLLLHLTTLRKTTIFDLSVAIRCARHTCAWIILIHFGSIKFSIFLQLTITMSLTFNFIWYLKGKLLIFCDNKLHIRHTDILIACFNRKKDYSRSIPLEMEKKDRNDIIWVFFLLSRRRQSNRDANSRTNFC